VPTQMKQPKSPELYDNTDHIICNLIKDLPTRATATIIVPAPLVHTLYKEASLAQRAVTETYGFSKGNVPLEYIQKNFQSNLLEHIEEFFLKYQVIDLLYQKIYEKKYVIAGEPRLTDVHVTSHDDALFYFELSLVPPPTIQEWRYLPFRAPKRKNYKDLDRQVNTFVKEEKEALERQTSETLSVGDWVCFSINLANRDEEPILAPHSARFWLKIGSEEADASFRDIFEGKHVGTSFFTTCQALQDYFGESIDTAYVFTVKIHACVPYSYFCLEKFKKQFKIKTKKALYQKLIEVFSYRNDLSQRRAMAQQAIALLLSKYDFELPSHVILREKKELLGRLKQNPDYHVYRTQKDFTLRVEQLAEKQAQEKLFLDHLAHYEKLTVTHQDIEHYLNLTNRPRSKEFIYFDPPQTKYQGQEIPLSEQELSVYCLREKTINYIIHYLTRK